MLTALRIWNWKWNRILFKTGYNVYNTRWYGTHYDTLKIKQDASIKDIKKAYVELSKQLHPDLNNSNPDSQTYFIQLNEAYKILSNPQSRQTYDIQIGIPTSINQNYGRQFQGLHMDQFTTSNTHRGSQQERKGSTYNDDGIQQNKYTFKEIVNLIYKGFVFIIALKILLLFAEAMTKISTGLERNMKQKLKDMNVTDNK